MSFLNTKHYNIEIYLSSIAQSTGQYFPVLPSCQNNTENKLFQYGIPRKVNTGFVIESVCIVTQLRKNNKYSMNPWEISGASPSKFSLDSEYISSYIPPLVTIQIQ